MVVVEEGMVVWIVIKDEWFCMCLILSMGDVI